MLYIATWSSCDLLLPAECVRHVVLPPRTDRHTAEGGREKAIVVAPEAGLTTGHYVQLCELFKIYLAVTCPQIGPLYIHNYKIYIYI